MSQETVTNQSPIEEKSERVEVDLLTEDTPIPGQEYGVYSFLSPEGIKGCNVRAFKNRGNFASYEEASAHAEKIRNQEPAFHVFVGENFKWTAFDPDPNLVKDNCNYYEPKLQELMKGTIANQEKAKQLESQRKRDMIEEAIKDEIRNKRSNKDKKVRDRLKNKLNKRKEQEAQATAEKEEKAVDVSKAKEEVTKINSDINQIDENLEKMKKLYADLLKKKEANNSA
jgi:hypothetical protein